MLNDYSLEKLINFKLKERVKNPLEFKDIEFEVNEWSNIPSLVP
jgi:hypothetical protein